jgi:hypothetical protein
MTSKNYIRMSTCLLQGLAICSDGLFKLQDSSGVLIDYKCYMSSSVLQGTGGRDRTT